jgi:hypothetical protein
MKLGQSFTVPFPYATIVGNNGEPEIGDIMQRDQRHRARSPSLISPLGSRLQRRNYGIVLEY